MDPATAVKAAKAALNLVKKLGSDQKQTATEEGKKQDKVIWGSIIGLNIGAIASTVGPYFIGIMGAFCVILFPIMLLAIVFELIVDLIRQIPLIGPSIADAIKVTLDFVVNDIVFAFIGFILSPIKALLNQIGDPMNIAKDYTLKDGAVIDRRSVIDDVYMGFDSEVYLQAQKDYKRSKAQFDYNNYKFNQNGNPEDYLALAGLTTFQRKLYACNQTILKANEAFKYGENWVDILSLANLFKRNMILFHEDWDWRSASFMENTIDKNNLSLDINKNKKVNDMEVNTSILFLSVGRAGELILKDKFSILAAEKDDGTYDSSIEGITTFEKTKLMESIGRFITFEDSVIAQDFFAESGKYLYLGRGIVVQQSALQSGINIKAEEICMSKDEFKKEFGTALQRLDEYMAMYSRDYLTLQEIIDLYGNVNKKWTDAINNKDNFQKQLEYYNNELKQNMEWKANFAGKRAAGADVSEFRKEEIQDFLVFFKILKSNDEVNKMYDDAIQNCKDKIGELGNNIESVAKDEAAYGSDTKILYTIKTNIEGIMGKINSLVTSYSSVFSNNNSSVVSSTKKAVIRSYFPFESDVEYEFLTNESKAEKGISRLSQEPPVVLKLKKEESLIVPEDCLITRIGREASVVKGVEGTLALELTSLDLKRRYVYKDISQYSNWLKRYSNKEYGSTIDVIDSRVDKGSIVAQVGKEVTTKNDIGYEEDQGDYRFRFRCEFLYNTLLDKDGKDNKVKLITDVLKNAGDLSGQVEKSGISNTSRPADGEVYDENADGILEIKTWQFNSKEDELIVTRKKILEKSSESVNLIRYDDSNLQDSSKKFENMNWGENGKNNYYYYKLDDVNRTIKLKDPLKNDENIYIAVSKKPDVNDKVLAMSFLPNTPIYTKFIFYDENNPNKLEFSVDAENYDPAKDSIEIYAGDNADFDRDKEISIEARLHLLGDIKPDSISVKISGNRYEYTRNFYPNNRNATDFNNFTIPLDINLSLDQIYIYDSKNNLLIQGASTEDNNADYSLENIKEGILLKTKKRIGESVTVVVTRKDPNDSQISSTAEIKIAALASYNTLPSIFIPEKIGGFEKYTINFYRRDGALETKIEEGKDYTIYYEANLSKEVHSGQKVSIDILGDTGYGSLLKKLYSGTFIIKDQMKRIPLNIYDLPQNIQVKRWIIGSSGVEILTNGNGYTISDNGIVLSKPLADNEAIAVENINTDKKISRVFIKDDIDQTATKISMDLLKFDVTKNSLAIKGLRVKLEKAKDGKDNDYVLTADNRVELKGYTLQPNQRLSVYIDRVIKNIANSSIYNPVSQLNGVTQSTKEIGSVLPDGMLTDDTKWAKVIDQYLIIKLLEDNKVTFN